MNVKIIFYSQKNLSPKARTKFKIALSGHNTWSHSKRYRYRIEGVLDKIEHIKPCNAVLIVKDEDYGEVIAMMEKHSVSYKSYNMEVSPEELKS